MASITLDVSVCCKECGGGLDVLLISDGEDIGRASELKHELVIDVASCKTCTENNIEKGFQQGIDQAHAE